MPEVYGVRLPPPSQRLTAPNFSIVPRSSGPPVEPESEAALPQIDPNLGNMLGALDPATREGSEAEGNLFGDDDEDDDDENEDEDDEEMEDVTGGLPPTSNGGSSFGVKRKADDDDEDYD